MRQRWRDETDGRRQNASENVQRQLTPARNQRQGQQGIAPQRPQTLLDFPQRQQNTFNPQLQLWNTQQLERLRETLRPTGGQNRNLQQQRLHLQALRQQQLANRRHQGNLYGLHGRHQQRLAWQQTRNRALLNGQQQRLTDQNHRLQWLNERQRNFYRSYVTYYSYRYWDNSYWLNRDYWNDRTFWSGPGYWYERDYWSQQGYLWNDVLTLILPSLVSSLVPGTVSSSITSFPPASTLYLQAPQILSFNGLTQTACEPGNVIILLPNRQVLCASPTYSFAPGTYRVMQDSLELLPAEIQY